MQKRQVRVRLPALFGLPAALIALVFSLSFYFFGAQLNARIEESLANNLVAEGKVVDVIQRTVTQRGEQKTFYYPLVEFQTAQGETVRIESSEGSGQAVSQLGETVRVFYNPNAPQEAFVDSPMLWLAPRLFMGVGGFIAFLSALLVLNGLLQALKLGGLLGVLSFIFLRQRRGQRDG
jgi:hypothetical protein